MRSWNVYKLTHYTSPQGWPRAKRTYTGTVHADTFDSAYAQVATRWPHLAERGGRDCEVTCEPWLANSVGAA